MRSLFTSALLAFTLTATGAADAALIQFSYTWASSTPIGGGTVLSGTVEGTVGADGNTITDIYNLNATHSGTPSRVFNDIFPAPSIGTFTLDGSDMRFYGFEDPFPEESMARDFGFALGSGGSAVVGSFFNAAGSPGIPCSKCETAVEAFSASRWTASIVAVPEPASLALVGFALAGLCAVRRVGGLRASG